VIDPTSAIAGAALVASQDAARKSIEAAATNLHQHAARIGRGLIDRMTVALGIGLNDFLQTTHQKCSTFKTILNSSKPISLTENYISITLECGNEKISDILLVEDLDNKRRIIVTGLAGSGKSMFMKYLTLARFNATLGKIPLFVELRNLNKLSSHNLLSFIRSSCTTAESNFTDEQFRIALKNGIFTLILDGFDEINFDIRDDIERQILDIGKNYPEVTVIVSSRPDPRFSSWAIFYVFEVQPLSLKQSIKLIQTLDYDSNIKKRFLNRVRSSLYNTHTSFLSSPLLTTIMLLTFEEFAEIPEKMHIFYAQAFDTLFQRHDAQKEQYQRQTRTKLTRLDFKLCVSAFCFFSYLDSSHSFDEKGTRTFAKNAIDFCSKTNFNLYSKIKPEDLISDLVDSVCILQPDGLLFSFVHRSFQEYFCADFISSLPGNHIRAVLDRIAVRFMDSVISMAYDINRSAIEKHWMVPNIDYIVEFFSLNSSDAISCAARLTRCISSLRVIRFSDSNADITISYSDAHEQIMSILYHVRSLLQDKGRHLAPWLILKRESMLENKENVLSSLNKKKKNYNNIVKLYQILDIKQDISIHFEISSRDSWWISIVDRNDYFSKMHTYLKKIRADIESRADDRQRIIDILLVSADSPPASRSS